MSESEVRLVPISAEQVERFRHWLPYARRLGYPELGDDLTALASRYEHGITKEEARASSHPLRRRLHRSEQP